MITIYSHNMNKKVFEEFMKIKPGTILVAPETKDEYEVFAINKDCTVELSITSFEIEHFYGSFNFTPFCLGPKGSPGTSTFGYLGGLKFDDTLRIVLERKLTMEDIRNDKYRWEGFDPGDYTEAWGSEHIGYFIKTASNIYQEFFQKLKVRVNATIPNNKKSWKDLALEEIHYLIG